MRRIVLYLLLAAAAVAVAAPAQAQRRRYYRDYDRPVGVEGQTILGLHLGVSSPTGDFDTIYNSGLGFGASIGYGVSRSVLLSFEVSHHSFDGDLPNDDASITPVTFNADYILPTGGRVIPWIGGGIGPYHHHEEVDDAQGGVLFDDSETAFGYNLGAGIAGPIAQRTLLGGGFRFHHVSGDRLLDAEFWTFQVGLGFVLR